MSSETDALAALVRAGSGRVSPEPVVALAVAVASPWCGDRANLPDGNRMAATSPDPLLRLLAQVQDDLAPPLPSARHGWLAWMRFHGLALPVRAIRRGPNWITSDVLEPGWVALPPRGGISVVAPSMLTVDGRLASLHAVAHQVGPAVPRDAVEELVGWFVGPRAATWSHNAGEQCAQMVWPTIAQTAWHKTFRNVRVKDVADVVLSTPAVTATWSPPPPSEEELAAQREAELRAQATVLNAAAGRKPRRTAAV